MQLWLTVEATGEVAEVERSGSSASGTDSSVVVGRRLDEYVYPAYRRGLRAFHDSLVREFDPPPVLGDCHGTDGPAAVEPELFVCRFTADSGILGGWAELAAAARTADGQIRYRLRPLAAMREVSEQTVEEPTPADKDFRRFFDAAAVGLALVDDGGGIVRANPALGEILDTDPELLAERSFLDFTHSDDRSTSLDAAGAVLDGGAPRRRLVKRYVTGDGSTVWARVTMTMLTDPVGDARKLTEVEDITSQIEAELRLTERAALDGLTGLANREAVLEVVEQRLAAFASGEPADWVLLFMDLDNFKKVNDEAGHSAGDRLLRAVGQVLAAATRHGDVAGRVGGDEFVLLVTTSGGDDAALEEQAHAAADRLLGALSALTSDPLPVPLGASIGVAVPRPRDSAAELIQRADEAMYRAKRLGGRRLGSPRSAWRRSG